MAASKHQSAGPQDLPAEEQQQAQQEAAEKAEAEGSATGGNTGAAEAEAVGVDPLVIKRSEMVSAGSSADAQFPDAPVVIEEDVAPGDR